MSSLFEQIQQIEEQIHQIRQSGEVAPEGYWINETRAGSRRKDGSYRYYTYYKLMSFSEEKNKQGKPKRKEISYLGKESNPKYQRWRSAIQRRDQIRLLRRQRKEMLQQLEQQL